MLRRLRVIGWVTVCGVVLSACTWPMFGFGPDHTHFNPVVSPLNTSNVGTMVLKGTGATGAEIQYSSPAVVPHPGLVNGELAGVVYIGSDDGKLYAFPQFDGSANCSGVPKTCTPLWTATIGGPVASSPAVVNGVVYIGSGANKFYAFDAAGSMNCTGSPKICSPLWTATTGGPVSSSPTVVNGVVYVGSVDRTLYAFDAGGRTNCSGTPRACTPLWAATTGGIIFNSSPAVVNGVVYIGSDDNKLYAFDATADDDNCAGTPKTCRPLWTAATGAGLSSSPAVVNGVVYIPSNDAKLYAFDAAGITKCSATPKTCNPLWTATIGFETAASPAVAKGVVYVASLNNTLYAFDAAGSINCSGVPKSCNPLWTATTSGSLFSSPAIENGIVFVGSADGNLYAFDAAGLTNCSGTPKACTALWAGATKGLVFSSPSPAGTIVYVGSSDGKLYAFGLPQP